MIERVGSAMGSQSASRSGCPADMTIVSATARAWNVADVFLGSLTALHAAVTGPMPLIRDRRLKLVPATGGFQLPGFYHWLLLPFSKRQVRCDAQAPSALPQKEPQLSVITWRGFRCGHGRCLRQASSE